jgi:flagellar biosynthesis/type III secretory pathway ATPase
VRELLASYRDSADLIEVGAYQAGSNPKVDKALACMNQLNAMLRQAPTEHASLEETLNRMQAALTPAPTQPRRPGA